MRLAIPEETVFVSEKTDPTASVFVETERGPTLTADQVQAIVHLTSASIDGPEARRTSPSSTPQGTVLSTVGGGASRVRRTKQASDYESGSRDAVQAMLDRVVGPGNATVAVAADMDQRVRAEGGGDLHQPGRARRR